jgi:hypothetical protein
VTSILLYILTRFDCLSEYEQRGITYLKMVLDKMFTMSDMVIMSLQRYLKQFAQEGIAKVPTEDVRVCSGQLVAMCTRLAEVNALPQESIGFILEGLTCCSVLEFKDIHRLLCTTHKVCQMRAVTGRRDSSATLAHIQRICQKACKVLHSMNLTNKWNIPQSYQADAFLTTCYNCGALDHTSNKCPLPRNEAKITKAKEVCAKLVKEGHGGCGCGCGGDRSGQGGGRGGDCTNTWNKWGANGGPVNPRNDKSSADGVKKKNGMWMMNCKSCGWNDTHTPGYHVEWSCDQSTFNLPGTHVFWSKSWTAPSLEKSPAPASSSTTPGVLKGQLSGLISRYKTRTDDGAFLSFLSEFEGLLK